MGMGNSWLAARKVGISAECNDSNAKDRSLEAFRRACPMDSDHTDTPDAATRNTGPGDTPTRTAALPAVPGYELEELIGRGGMGDVYRARDLELDREVAVKILQQHYPADSPTAARFLEEARITGQLQHPGVPAIYRVAALPDGRPFLAIRPARRSTTWRSWRRWPRRSGTPTPTASSTAT
jgi:serine/threonine protein kinase